MSMKRKNKASNGGGGKDGYNAEWYNHNVKRQRSRNKISKASRRKNR